MQLPGCISFQPFLKHPSRKIDTKNFKYKCFIMKQTCRLWWHIKDKRKMSPIWQVKFDIPFRFLTTNWETNHQTEAISKERAFANICVADKGNFGEHSRALALLNTPRGLLPNLNKGYHKYLCTVLYSRNLTILSIVNEIKNHK